MFRFKNLALGLFVPVVAVFGQDAPRFEGQIRPVFQARCFPCHDAKNKQAGLSLEERDDLLKGGKTGAAIVPRKSSDSLMLSMISSGRMPMGGAKMADTEIELLRRWIDAGALSDRDKEMEGQPLVAVTERELSTSIVGAKCLVCHGRRRQEGGLDLRTRASMLKGGKSGPAIVPGKPEESLMVKRIASQQMPPPHLQEQFSVRGLTSDEFEKLKHWIASGAPEDREQPVDVRAEADAAIKPKDREFWSFRPPVRPKVPEVRGQDRVRTPLDAFLLEKLEAKSMTFSKEAPKLTLMRRAHFDLLGLPPSPEEIREYLADSRPDAYERLIDRLLESPHYGERWARYWMDAVGYADSEGGVSNDTLRPHAWRYRDYVIRSLNADKPYDRFLIEQIAGDELLDYRGVTEYSADQVEKLVATGFWRMAPDPTYSTEQNFIPERLDVVASQLDILGTSVMGLTIGCARCHDHKYDPIPQRDFYRMSAMVQPALDPWDWLAPNEQCVGVGAKCDDSTIRFLPLLSIKERKLVEEHNAPFLNRIGDLEKQLEVKAAPLREKLRAEKIAAVPADVREDLQKALDTPEAQRTEIQRYLAGKFLVAVKAEEIEAKFEDYRKEAMAIRRQIQEQKRSLKPMPKIRAMFEMGGEPTPNRIMLRGEYTNSGPLVAPGTPSVLSVGLEPYRLEKPAYRTQTTGRRLALAKWLVQPNHPLTSRVMVNRIWQNHFGVGLVASPGNFGKTGLPPSHPELLDWLSTEFVRQGWSIKAMHRLIMTSTAYRQSSRSSADNHTADPANVLLSRFPLRRLDADALRDSILKVAGRLDLTPFGPPDETEVKPEGEVLTKTPKTGERRSIYQLQRRSKMLTMLDVFDAPQLTPNCLRRSNSTVASQALQMMNSELVRNAARYMAGRVMDSAGTDAGSQIERIFLTALAREATAEEMQTARTTLEGMRREWLQKLESELPAEPVRQKAEWLALSTLCHTFLNSAEFMYID